MAASWDGAFASVVWPEERKYAIYAAGPAGGACCAFSSQHACAAPWLCSGSPDQHAAWIMQA